MKSYTQMRVRQEIFDIYRYFTAERQNIFFKRLSGASKPRTNDPILAEYKFCNVYRAADRVSQYLIKHVIYHEGNYTAGDILFRILLFKIFNKIETRQYLERSLGDIRLSTYNFEKFDTLLDQRQQSGNAIYTSAYMSCANKAYGFDKKHQNHLKLLEQMFFTDHITEKIISCKTFEELYEILRDYPLLGNFMAYQLATDINYSEVVDFTEHSFCKAGPGAERGIKKCFENTDGKSSEDVIQRMYEHQEHEFKRL